MARETRRQRRAARAAAGDGASTRRGRQVQARPAQQPVKQQTGRREPKPRGQFIRESYAELKKVEWPNQQQLISGTAVVLVACLITGVYLYANDRLWQWVVQHLLFR